MESGGGATPVWKLDDSRSPLVLVYVDGSDGVAPPDLDSLLAIFDRLVERKQPKAAVIDLTHAKPDAARRQRIVEWARAHWASVRTDLVCIGAVTTGPFQRAIITGLLWFVEAPCPVQTFENRAQAIAWAQAQLHERKL